MTYPIHFRKKVLAKLEQGMSIRELAEKYDISPTTIQQWKKKIEPQVGFKRVAKKIDLQVLKADIAQYPYDFMAQRADRFDCSVAAMSKAIKRHGLKLARQAKYKQKA